MNTLHKIKIYSFMTLDGMASDTDGDIDWILEYPRPVIGNYGYRRFCDSVSCCVISSIYHKTLLSYDIRLLPDKPCHILPSEPGNDEEVISLVKDLQRQSIGDLWLAGDSHTIALLLEHELIDQMTIGIIPITLGNGLPLFNRSSMSTQDLSLKNCKQYDNGVVMLEYTVNSIVF